MSYGDFNDLAGRTASDKTLPDKAFDITKNSKHGYQRRLVSMVHKFFGKKTLGGTVKKKNIWNKELAEELQ